MTPCRRGGALAAADHCSYRLHDGTRRFVARLLVLAVCAASGLAAVAEEAGRTGTRQPNSGSATSDRAAQVEAMHAIPWKKIPTADRRLAQFVTNNASIYRRLPTRVIDCDPEMFTFLAQHPEVLVDVWRVMGISRVKLERKPDGTYRGTDGAGTTGKVRFLYTDWGRDADNLALVYADGAYEGRPFLEPVRAQSVLLLQSGAIQETNGRHYVTVRVDSFVRVEHIGLDLLAKTVRPLITRSADRNFVDTLTFVSTFSRTAEQNPQGMQRLACRLTTVDEPTRRELVQLCFRTAGRYAHLEQTDKLGRAEPHFALLVARSR